MDIKQRIETAKADLRRAENAKTVAETQKESAEGQLEEVRAKMTAAGVTPENINAEVEALEGKINADLDKFERLIPKV